MDAKNSIDDASPLGGATCALPSSQGAPSQGYFDPAGPFTAINALSHPNVDAARKCVIRAIRDARVRLEIPPHELADALGVSKLVILDDDFKGDVPLSEVLGLSAILGISQDRILPLAPLTNDARIYWLNQMEANHVQNIAGVDNVELEQDVTIALYVRFQALGELFSS